MADDNSKHPDFFDRWIGGTIGKANFFGEAMSMVEAFLPGSVIWMSGYDGVSVDDVKKAVRRAGIHVKDAGFNHPEIWIKVDGRDERNARKAISQNLKIQTW